MEYQLRPLGKTCAATGQPLKPGSLCYSVMVEKGLELERLDFSPEGWTGPPENTVAHWKCRVPVPTESKKKLLDPDALMTLFDRLYEEANPLEDKLRFILAILLIRQKRLKLEGSRFDGDQEYLQLLGTQGDGTYEVCELQLSEEERVSLQEQLNARLAVEGSPL